jgi:hypothetical protein
MDGESHQQGISEEELDEGDQLSEDPEGEWEGIAQDIEDGQPSENDASDDDEVEEVPKEAPKSAPSWLFTSFKCPRSDILQLYMCPHICGVKLTTT